MKTTQIPRNDFAAGLRKTRDAQGLSQEDFGLVSSRTYVSSLERGLKSPTLNKVDDLANTLGVHPLTLLFMSYVEPGKESSAMELLEAVRAELQSALKHR
jgi:transcriptional regulator with XRE-family HTH domain